MAPFHLGGEWFHPANAVRELIDRKTTAGKHGSHSESINLCAGCRRYGSAEASTGA